MEKIVVEEGGKDNGDGKEIMNGGDGKGRRRRG